MTSASAGPMAQGPSPSSLSHDWASDQNGTSHLSYTSSTQPLTQALTEQSASSADRTSSSLTRSRSIIGLHPEAPIDEEHDHGPASELLWSRIRTVLREPFAEFWGVAIMVMFGDGSVAQVLLSTGQATAPGGNGFGSYQSINWG
jgi:aquaglyceroporin related protein